MGGESAMSLLTFELLRKWAAKTSGNGGAPAADARRSFRVPLAFTLKEVAELVRTVVIHQIGELQLEYGTARLRIVNGGAESTKGMPLAVVREGDTWECPVCSPTVGTLYWTDRNGGPKVGERLDYDTLVAYVEQLGCKHEIRAPVSGKIAVRLADEGDPVEFGQPLFVVRAEAK